MKYTVLPNVLGFNMLSKDFNFHLEHISSDRNGKMGKKQDALTLKAPADSKKAGVRSAKRATVWEKSYAKKVAGGWWPKRVTRKFKAAFQAQKAKAAFQQDLGNATSPKMKSVNPVRSVKSTLAWNKIYQDKIDAGWWPAKETERFKAFLKYRNAQAATKKAEKALNRAKSPKQSRFDCTFGVSQGMKPALNHPKGDCGDVPFK